MNLRDLSYLVALAEHRHFGKAADICFVSQPALSMQIKKLENYLGVQLLERTNKSVFLTEAGDLLAQKARQILIQVEEFKEAAKLTKDLFSGEVKIGIIPTLAPYLLPHIMQPILAEYPKLTIFLIEEQTQVIVQQLKEGHLDAIILALPVMEESFVSTPLFEEEFSLAVHHKHPLAKRKIIKQSDLANKNLLLLEKGHCLRDQALAVCQSKNAEEFKNFRATSLETLRHMIASGIGMTLIPRLACQKNDGITYLEFTQPKPLRVIGMQWRISSAKNSVLQAISHTIKKTLSLNKKIKII